jgi:hypothetical protein
MLRDAPLNARVVFETPDDNAYEIGDCSEDLERSFFVSSKRKDGEEDWMESDVVVLRNN